MSLSDLKDVTKNTSFLRCVWNLLKTSQKSHLFWDVPKRSLRCPSQWRPIDIFQRHLMPAGYGNIMGKTKYIPILWALNKTLLSLKTHKIPNSWKLDANTHIFPTLGFWEIFLVSHGYFSILYKMLEKHLWNSFSPYLVVENLYFLHEIAISERCPLKEVPANISTSDQHCFNIVDQRSSNIDLTLKMKQNPTSDFQMDFQTMSKQR